MVRKLALNEAASQAVEEAEHHGTVASTTGSRLVKLRIGLLDPSRSSGTSNVGRVRHQVDRQRRQRFECTDGVLHHSHRWYHTDMEKTTLYLPDDLKAAVSARQPESRSPRPKSSASPSAK